MYSIKQASLRSGVSVPLLRQWERRYGVVAPRRTPSGYRQYDETAIERLRRMRALVDDGWSPSAAADALRELVVPDLAALDVIAADRGRERGPEPDLVQAFVRAATALDVPGIEATLDEMFGRGSYEQTVEQYLLPALRTIGQVWERGEGGGNIAAEHAASNAVLRRLGAAFQAAGRATMAQRPILVGLPPGAHHELGALAFSVAARRSGLPILYLGADLPGPEWIEAASRTHAIAAVIGVVTAADVEPALRVAAAMTAAHPDVRVAFGGTGVDAMTHDDHYLRLPAALTASVDALQALVATTRR